MSIIFNGRADAGATKTSYQWQEEARSDSITIIQCPDGFGEMFRFSSKPTDGYVNGDFRAELSTHIATPLSEEWYAFELYIPSSGIPQYMPRGIVAQWHSVDSGPEAYGRQPPVDFDLRLRDHLRCSVRWDANATSIASPDSVTTEELMKYPAHQLFDRRVPVVVRCKWDWGATGLFEVWMDHYPVISRVGPLSFNDAQGPYIKIGIAHCLHGVTSEEIVIMNSGAKIGDANSSYYEMTGRYPYPRVAQQGALA